MQNVCFTGKPLNYSKINEQVSRSAQPNKEDFIWLKENSITDIIDFRTTNYTKTYFDEKKVVESLGMKYHNIPTYTRTPKEEQVKFFLNLINSITENGGKVHLHCQAGSDRTGMYSFIYKSIKHIGSISDNVQEWIRLGLHQKLYPNLISWANDCVSRLKKK